MGRDTQLFRANLRGGVSLGPTCRIGGEVEAAIVHGYTNKYHEGFLGHAYVGEWVNLGAGTVNFVSHTVDQIAALPPGMLLLGAVVILAGLYFLKRAL